MKLCPNCSNQVLGRQSVCCSRRCGSQYAWKTQREKFISGVHKRNFLGERNPNFGNHVLKDKPIPLERKLRMIASLRKAGREGRLKNRRGRKGQSTPEHVKLKLSQASKRYFENHPEARLRLREQRLSQILPLERTSIELLFEAALRNNGLDFTPQKVLLGLTQVDFFLEPNIAIFIDGCYWHGCIICFNHKKFTRLIKRRWYADKYITTKLASSGYVVLRFWEHEIRNQERLTEILQSIQNLLSEPRAFKALLANRAL